MRRIVLALMSLAPVCVLAQSDTEELPPPPEPRLEAYQALKGIDAAAWKALELSPQAGVQAKHARLPKRIEVESTTYMTFRGLLSPSRTVGTTTTSTSRLSPLSGGFVLVESDFTIESERMQGSGKSTQLRWLGLIALYTHEVSSAKTRLTLGTHESSGGSITRLDKWGSSDLKLEDMKPGYRWTVEYRRVTDQTRAFRRTAEEKRSCEAAEGGAANTLDPELSGNFLKVTCEDVTRSPPVPAEWAYLEDYGYFLVLEAGTERAFIINRYKVLEPGTGQ